MTDIEEIRVALKAGTRLPGDVLARPGAAALVRVRARRHQARRLAVVSATAVGIIVAAVTVGLTGSLGPHTVIATPGPTASSSAPSSTSGPTTAVTVSPGPRTFAVPVEIHLVRTGSLTAGCDSSPPAGTVPSAEGDSCYRLGPPALTIRHVSRLEAGPAVNSSGTTTAGTAFLLTLSGADRAALAALTTASVDKQLAIVVAGLVYSAPTVATPIRGGQIEIDVGPGAARRLLAELGG